MQHGEIDHLRRSNRAWPRREPWDAGYQNRYGEQREDGGHTGTLPDVVPGERPGLRSQPLDAPAGALGQIAEAVVHAVAPALPELEHRGRQSVAAPERRQWYLLVFVFLLHLFDHRFENCA